MWKKKNLIIRFKGVPLNLKADPGAGSHRGLELGTRKLGGTKVDKHCTLLSEGYVFALASLTVPNSDTEEAPKSQCKSHFRESD